MPSLNGNNTPNIKDIQVTFYCDYDNSQIIGTIGDFFEFFTDKSFNIVPPEAVVTADLVPLVTDLPEDVPKIKKFTKPKNSGDGSEE